MVKPMRKYHSQFFTLRLWTEPGATHRAGEKGEIRCKVQHLRSGEVRYFGDWPALIAYLTAVIAEDGDDTLRSHLPGESL